MQLSDRITGPFLVALGALAAYGGSRLPPVPGQQVGPNVFPMVVGIGLVLCGVLIALGVGRRFEEEAEADLARPRDPMPESSGATAGCYGLRALLPPALLLFYVLVGRPARLPADRGADRARRGAGARRAAAARGAAGARRAALRASRLLQAAAGAAARRPAADAVVSRMSTLLEAFRLVAADRRADRDPARVDLRPGGRLAARPLRHHGDGAAGAGHLLSLADRGGRDHHRGLGHGDLLRRHPGLPAAHPRHAGLGRLHRRGLCHDAQGPAGDWRSASACGSARSAASPARCR